MCHPVSDCESWKSSFHVSKSELNCENYKGLKCLGVYIRLVFDDGFYVDNVDHKVYLN